MVTAGPTLEAIDPVRYISNHSTGKMGYAIAAELSARGARVTLVSGRTGLPVPAGVERIDVVSADDMYRAAAEVFPQTDGAVMCAAVADYTPAEPSGTKIKKKEGAMDIKLRPTKDIALELGRQKEGRILAGFALETDRELEHARGKMERKGFDFIVLNSLREEGAGFGHDTNKITILESDGTVNAYPLESKQAAAARVADILEKYLIK